MKKMATKNKKKSRSKFWKWTKRILLLMFISSTFYLIMCRWVMPPVTITQVANYMGGYGAKRTYVDWDEISPNVKLAAIASEDQMFLDHSGFDWKAMEKSYEEPKNKRKKRKRIKGGGASTISQQTAKNVFLWQGNGVSRYIRKVPEFYFTQLIEWTWSKKRIMEVYLNTIEMGPGIFGIEAAAQHYYKKHAKNLSRAEAAAIIACLPNPKKYSVVPQSRWVAWKSGFILRQMNNIQHDADIQGLIK
jgi:monofunctional biosynthetic peptidoglycan transglycosylase